MMCDTPVLYEREKECTSFITAIPTVWDESIALDGKIGEYVSLARRKGDVWYVGALTNWDGRQLTIDLSFLDEGNWVIEMYMDGVNADMVASDYKKQIIPVPQERKLTVTMAAGGGCAMRIYKQ